VSHTEFSLGLVLFGIEKREDGLRAILNTFNAIFHQGITVESGGESRPPNLTARPAENKQKKKNEKKNDRRVIAEEQSRLRVQPPTRRCAEPEDESKRRLPHGFEKGH
jgi:hypothetical protein